MNKFYLLEILLVRYFFQHVTCWLPCRSNNQSHQKAFGKAGPTKEEAPEMVILRPMLEAGE
jgi:hypothetical protein